MAYLLNKNVWLAILFISVVICFNSCDHYRQKANNLKQENSLLESTLKKKEDAYNLVKKEKEELDKDLKFYEDSFLKIEGENDAQKWLNEIIPDNIDKSIPK